MTKVVAVIIAGGNGERFWPLSTDECPKQFLSIFDERPLIRQAVDRLEGLIVPERIFVITSERYLSLTREALPMVPEANILGEPCSRGTAAAVAVACGIVKRHGGDKAIACVLTADHLMRPAEAFRQTLMTAIERAQTSEAIVTIGIEPTRPDTGFGYIECGQQLAREGEPCHKVVRFVEKPNHATATAYLSQGGFLWNSGMFIWQARVMRNAFAMAAPDFLPLVDKVALAGDTTSILSAEYPALRKTSIDYAVMERYPSILVVKGRFGWDDVGSWAALERHFSADEMGNVKLGKVVLLDDKSVCAVNCRDPKHLLVVSGLKDVVVVDTPNATLVCSKEQAANMRAIVAAITEK